MAADRATLTRQIKEASDIVAVIGGYLPLKPAGKTYKGLCPFHNDHRPSFDVDPQRQRFRCWACGKFGDVFTFIQEHEKVSFLEARGMLAQRAGIRLDGDEGPNQERLQQFEAIRWAAEQFHQCLLDDPFAERARKYLGERRLQGETIRRFGLGFAPGTGDWFLNLARRSGMPLELFEKLGLIAQRSEGGGWYDRFRDRVMFPIRDAGGRSVGFGGRILPDSPLADRAPKYYNSPDSPLFNKSELIYGLDLARQSAASAGYLAVVEGYTDVMMAHQWGIPHVVATMGTALNARHIQQLHRYVPRVVLVFDADAGGNTGVDRALAIFVNQNVDLAIATLPEGLDPCDLLMHRGPEPFLQALKNAVDVFEFALERKLTNEGQSIDGRRRVADAVLGVIAAVPEAATTEYQVKREVMVTRLVKRLGLREETVWERLRELRASRREENSRPLESSTESPRVARAPRHERELMELLLAAPEYVAQARRAIQPDELGHPGLRELLAGLYGLLDAGESPDLDALRPRIDNAALAVKALELQHSGLNSPADRPVWFRELAAAFESRRNHGIKEQLRSQLTVAVDDETAIDLLRQLKNQAVVSDL